VSLFLLLQQFENSKKRDTGDEVDAESHNGDQGTSIDRWPAQAWLKNEVIHG